MSMPDLSDPEINKHIKAVQDGTERWMVLGYVPKSNNKIKFYESGNGGLEELREELSDSSIRFAYISYQINNLPKFCYIAYCGDGVNGPIKGSFSGHAIEIGKILKPCHHQVNGRNEEDVDEKSIIAALTRAGGASYDSGAKIQGSTSKINVPTSVAQGRTQATQSNVQQKSFDKADYNKKDESQQYWKQNAAPVETKTVKPDRPEYNITSERDNYWKEQQQNASPKPAPTTSSAAPSRTVANRFQEMAAAPQTAPVKAPPPRSTGNVASRFQQQTAPAPAPTPAPKPAKSAPFRPAFQAEPEPEPVYEEPAQEQYYEEPAQEQHYDESQQQYDQQYDQQQYEEQPAYDESQQQYDESQHYDESQQHYDESQQHYDEPQQQYEEQPAYDESQQQYEEQPAEQHYDEQQYSEEQQAYPQAQALYAYQGESEGDLTFNEGDIINVMDKSDPSGWWQGECNGLVGFFPMNFVKEI